MSLEITYSASKRSYKWRFTNHEAEALEILASRELKDKIEDIIGVSGFGEECHINRKKLCDSIVYIIKGIENKKISLPSFFDIKAEIPRGSGNYSTGGTAICGLKIDGDEYEIEHGLNECILVKKWQDTDMKIHYGERIDVRHQSIIETDEDSFTGDIKILKRKMSKILLENLKNLKSFLDGCTEDDIVKVLG